MERVKEQMGFLELFDGLIISAAESLIKPDPAIFQLCIERFQLEPARFLFVDDLETNIAAAQKESLQGFLFAPEPDSAAQHLTSQLEAAGLI